MRSRTITFSSPLERARRHSDHVSFLSLLEKYDHFALRGHLKSLGISRRTVTEPIAETSTGKLMEGVLAAFAQF
jgi:hypothetical protein